MATIEPKYMHKNVYARLTWLVKQRVKAEAKLTAYEGKDTDYIKKWLREAHTKREAIAYILKQHAQEEKIKDFYNELENKEAKKWMRTN